MKKFIITAAACASLLSASAQVNSPNADGYLSRGKLMFEDRNYVGCIDQMNYLKSINHTDAETEDADYYIAMSAAHLRQADAMSLARYFLWRYPASPRCPIVNIAIGDMLKDNGQYGDAFNVYNAIDASTLDRQAAADLKYNMGFCLLKRGEYDRALPLFQSLRGNKKHASGARFYEGYIAYVKGDYRRASELFRGVDTSTAPGDMADYYLAQIYFLDRDYAKASTMAKRLLKADVEPQYKAEAARVAGESEYALGNDAEAITMLRQYVAMTETPLPSALYILGVADYRAGDYENAIKRLTPVTAQDNAMGQSAYLFIGQSMMQQGNYSAAMIAFEKAYKMTFDNDTRETAFYNYAVARTEGGRVPFGSSVSTFEEFLRAFPSSRYASRVREYLVTGYMTDNNYPAALASIEAIANPSEKILKAKQQVLYTLGSRELAAGQTDAAVNHLRQARSMRSHDAVIGAETDLWLGEALYAQGRFDDAAASLKAAVANRSLSADNRPLALYDLGYARFSAQRYDDALDAFNRFLNQQGKSSNAMVADAYNRVGDCFYYDSSFSKADDAYQKAFDINPEAGDYPLFQGALMKGLQRDRQGKIDGLKSMIQRFPSSGLVPQALLEIGETYDEMRLPDKTVETYSMLAARYPSTAQGRQANLLLALTYLNNDNRPQAIETYKNLIKAAPTSDEARQATEKLKTLMADDGRLDQYASFVNSIPGANSIEADELESLAFTAAEREYLSNGTTARLVDYLDRYANGTNRAQALAYATRANTTSGNRSAALRYANELVDNYPDSPLAPEALKAKADAELAMGRGPAALASYQKLEQTASSPYLVSDARLGIIRTARDLGENDLVIEAADRLLASSTLADDARSEARFARALALSLNGQSDEAAAVWKDMSSNLADVNGAKASYYLAQQQFDKGDRKDARVTVEALIDSDTPHNYWLARGFILLSDINRAEGNKFEADQYLISLRENYPGTESDIFNMIDQRLRGSSTTKDR